MSRERAPKNSKLLFYFLFLFPSIDSARALTEIAVRNSESAQSESRASAKPEQHRHARARTPSLLSFSSSSSSRTRTPAVGSRAEQWRASKRLQMRTRSTADKPPRISHTAHRTRTHAFNCRCRSRSRSRSPRLASPRLAQRTKIDTLHLTPFPPPHLHLHPPPLPSPIVPNMSTTEVETLVIGAGPTGLGAAKRLNQLVSVGQGTLELRTSNLMLTLRFRCTEPRPMAAHRRQQGGRRPRLHRHHRRGLPL